MSNKTPPPNYDQRKAALEALAARIAQTSNTDSNKAHEMARRAAQQHERDEGRR